jgi:hypothetical protein
MSCREVTTDPFFQFDMVCMQCKHEVFSSNEIYSKLMLGTFYRKQWHLLLNDSVVTSWKCHSGI